MKRAMLAFTLVCAFAARLCAGPEPLPSGKEMKEVLQPAPPPCPNWTGFYVGGFGGYKFGVIDPTLRLGGDWDLFPPDVSTLKSRADDDLNTGGTELGGLIGYNYQWNKWVVGLEAAGGYLWLRDSHGEGDFFSTNGNQFFTSTSFKTHYLMTVGPRIGYAVCKWLPYLTGGLAVGDLDFFQQFRAPDFFPESAGGSVSETNAGWFVGGGLQYSITDHWSTRAQYQFVDLGSAEFDHDSVPSTFPSSSKVELREHNVSFAIIYKF